MERYIYKHVVIIGIDGMGNFNKDTDTPRMDEIFGKGAQNFYAYSLYPTISAQNWGAMLLGTDPEIHGLTNSVVGSVEYDNKELPSLFTTVRKAYPDSLLCSYCNWNPINYGIIEHNVGVEMDTAENDEILVGKIEECISRKPKLLFIQLDDVDGAGHGHVYGQPGHLNQIKITDGYVGRIYDAYVKAGIAEETLFICIADHGGFEHGHGGYTDGEKYIYFAVAGKTVKTGDMGTAQTKDISAIALYALGIDRPDFKVNGYSSQVPLNVFEGTEDFTYSTETMEKDSPLEYNHRETPAIDSEDGLLSFFGKDDIKFALFFDDNYKDAVGKVDFKEHGHMKFYSTGRYGSMGELGSIGWLTAEGVKFGKDSFSIGMWLKTDYGYDGHCYICGTKAMRQASKGFMIVLTSWASKFCIEGEDHDTYDEYLTKFNYIQPGPWAHVLYSFDREKMELNIYHDFVLKRTVKIPENNYDTSMDNMTFTVGNECSFKGNNEFYNYIFNIDDLLCFNKALTSEDVKKLSDYYRI